MGADISAQGATDGSPGDPPAGAGARWFFGPGRDLLLGCGLAYLGIFVVLGFAGAQLETIAPAGLLPLVILFTGIPHYGATLLRVYDRSEDRHNYALFAVFATALVWLLFVVGVHYDAVGSLLLTIYLTWSPWHYTAQNYGIAMMFLGRRGVPCGPLTKRLIHATFVLSFFLTLFAIHSIGNDASYAPLSYEATVYHFLPLGIPGSLGELLVAIVGGGYLVCLAAAAQRLLRLAPARTLAPVAAIAFTQALWFSAPIVARQMNWLGGLPPLSLEHSAYAFLWVGIGHSVQYLWVTSYFASRSAEFPGQLRHYGKALVAGAAIWVVPALVFAPTALGRVPYDAGLAVMVASIVNIHHFILDGAIWKLRDGQIARVLLRGASPSATRGAAGREAGATRSWLRPMIVLTGAACAVIFAFGTLEAEYGGRRASAAGDTARVELAAKRLRAIGWDSSALQLNAALLHARDGNLESALIHAERARALFPTDDVWRMLGFVNQQLKRRDDAIFAYRRALAGRPAWPEVENNLAWLLATAEGSQYDADEAVRLARSVSRHFQNQNANALDTLAVAYASAGRFARASEMAQHAARLARDAGDDQLAMQIDQRRALYRSARPYREP